MGGLAQRVEHRVAVAGSLCIVSLVKDRDLGRVVEQAPRVVSNPKVFTFEKARPLGVEGLGFGLTLTGEETKRQCL